MYKFFTAESNSKGGRPGNIKPPAGMSIVASGVPLEKRLEKRGPAPELLFAGVYSACLNGAVKKAAKKPGTPVSESRVRAMTSLIGDDEDGYRLAVELHAIPPVIDRAQVHRIMDETHKPRPFPKANRGEKASRLTDVPPSGFGGPILPSRWRQTKTNQQEESL